MEVTDFSPEIDDFHHRWNFPLRGSNPKADIARRLRNTKTDLNHFIREEHREPVIMKEPKPEPELSTYAITDLPGCATTYSKQ